MRTPMIPLLTLTFLATLLAVGTALPQDILKNRARWEWSLPDGKGKVKESTFTGWVSGGLTVGKGKTEKDRTPIGRWSSPAPNEIHLVIDKKDHPLAGTSRVKMVKDNPPTYHGELTHKNGKKERVIFRLFQD